MTSSKKGAGDRRTAARVDAGLDAVNARLAAVRRDAAEVKEAGTEAWRAVEPDVRRLVTEVRGVIARAGDRFREARSGARRVAPAGVLASRAAERPAPEPPPAPGATTGE
jgi:hypothetical protein